VCASCNSKERFSTLPIRAIEVSTQEWQGTFRADFTNGAYTDDDIADVFTPADQYPHFTSTRTCSFERACITSPAMELTYGSGRIGALRTTSSKRFGGYYGGTLNEFRVQANYPQLQKFSISVPRRGTASGCPCRMEIFRSCSRAYKGTIRLAAS